MIWGMSADHVTLHSDSQPGTGITAPVSSVILLSNNQSRIHHIEYALKGSACAELPVVKDTLKSDLHQIGPDQRCLIILDVQDAAIDPLHELKRVRNINATSPLILLHATADSLVASRSLRAGATGFLAAREINTLFNTAIEKATAGERFVSEEVMQGILHGMTENSESDSHIPVEVLSDREMMVFQLLGKGKCPRNIAEELGVNIKTVATHCNNIRRKLHTPDNQHLTKISVNWTAGRTPSASGNDSPFQPR